MDYTEVIAKELDLRPAQVVNTMKLLEQGNTIPFISRYRKEMTGSMDETQVLLVRDMHRRLVEIEKRRESILGSLAELGLLTAELEEKIRRAGSLTELEDIYLPYKPKRKTRASVAREKGLEPLADILLAQKGTDPEQAAEKFVNEAVATVDEALSGARDILAERFSEDQQARERIRNLFAREALISSRLIRGKEEEGSKYSDYFDYCEELRKIPSHRLLAVRRGEEEGILSVRIEPGREKAIPLMQKQFVAGKGAFSRQVELAVEDSYVRLLQPSMESEYRNLSKEKADEESIRVFADNLKQLLLASPLGQKRILAIDPGYRTGCKLVCLDAQGNLLHNETVYPHPPQNEAGTAIKKIVSLSDAYKIEAIAVGNGTASRETESLIRKARFNRDVKVFVVSENGASVYSASEAARKELPGYDVTVRGAVSIGRRLMDPLAELVKIDPKSIGVGQYQHDVDQKKLKEKLDQVVEHCVNLVGVSVNTASPHLLAYVSGLGPQLAGNIVEHRKTNGPFRSREELKQVKRMGEKAFEQSAGFLRIEKGTNVLDNSAVHPESYHIVEKMAADLGIGIGQMIGNSELKKKLVLERYAEGSIGIPTLKDILAELEKPGRDPRPAISVFEFDRNVHSIQDLVPGMILPGIVTNVTNFGIFVDVGVKQDGLVHVSNLADRFIRNPAEVVKLHQHVQVRVLSVDVTRKRIQLSMKLSEKE